MSTLLSPAQAAKVAQVSRRTIMRAIDSKHLRAHPDNKNQWRIRPEDLEDWRPAHPAQWAPSGQAQEDAHPAQESAHPDKALQDEVETLRKELAVEKVRREAAEGRAATAEADRDAWKEQAQALANRPVPEKPQEPDKSSEVVDAQWKRLEDMEARMTAAVEALERAQERASVVAGVKTTPARGRPGFLARLMGRG